jgi:hypothetical protein
MDGVGSVLHRSVIYKVVQIWPGQTVTCLHTNRPGHIWTTLYIPENAERFAVNFVRCQKRIVSAADDLTFWCGVINLIEM